MKEIWKTIPGHDGYEVSNLGNIRSYKIKGSYKLRNTPIMLTPGVVNEYRRIVIKSKLVKIATMVMLAFVGPRPEGMDICHFNDIKTDGQAVYEALNKVRTEILTNL